MKEITDLSDQITLGQNDIQTDRQISIQHTDTGETEANRFDIRLLSGKWHTWIIHLLLCYGPGWHDIQRYSHRTLALLTQETQSIPEMFYYSVIHMQNKTL